MKGPYARTTMLWPTRALENGRRYIVAYRNLKSASGPITPSTAFKVIVCPMGVVCMYRCTCMVLQALRDKLPSSDPNVNLRRAHFEEIFQMLEKVGEAVHWPGCLSLSFPQTKTRCHMWSVGVDRSSLVLAWDYSVGSRDSITGRWGTTPVC